MTAYSLTAEIPVTLVGHPFANVGMGEQFRSHIAACQTVHMPFGVLDIYRYAARSDSEHRALVELHEIKNPRDGIRIFHINGDEVEPVLQAFEARGGVFADGYNIIIPAWELPSYPTVWAEQLRKFDEVWAISRFVADSLHKAGIHSTLIGQAVEMPLGYMLPRKYFGVRESAFAVLHFFDLSSYASRKNPDAVLRMFEAIRRKREFDDIQLVLKVKQGDEEAGAWLQPLRDRIPEAHFISRPLTSLETRSLINACDCFVSLHRAEGFGRGTGEAMFLGRLAMGTAWSGNVDYMTQDNSLLVDYDLVPVGAGEYPFGEGQHWADARADHAAALLDDVIANPEQARALAARGRRDIRLGHGYRAVGLRVLDRVTEVMAMMRAGAVRDDPPARLTEAEEATGEPIETVALSVLVAEQEGRVEGTEAVDPTAAVPEVSETVAEESAAPAVAVEPGRYERQKPRKRLSARARKQAALARARAAGTLGLDEAEEKEASDAVG